MCSFFVLALTFYSCEGEKEEELYSFFVAGHVYGKPGTSDIGIYKPFKEEFQDLKKTNFGVYTGDAVIHSKNRNWDAFFKDAEELDSPFHLAPGNHDTYNKEVFANYWEKSYYSFIYENDLHIILDGNNGWNIKEEQLTFLKAELSTVKPKQNIFIYSHQVLWQDRFSQPKNVIPNSAQGRDSILTFKTAILPTLKALDNPIYMLAGDVGAGAWASNFTYYFTENIRLITSGMGDGKRDHYLKISVSTKGHVDISIKPLRTASENFSSDIEFYKKPF